MASADGDDAAMADGPAAGNLHVASPPPSPPAACTLLRLLTDSAMTLTDVVQQDNTQHIEQYLASIHATLTSEVGIKTLLCVRFARTVRALQRAFGDDKPVRATNALYTWIRVTHSMDGDWEKTMRRNQTLAGRLWRTDEDCDWWEHNLAAQSLKIKSFNRLMQMALRYERMLEVLGSAQARRDWWLEELSELRDAKETKVRLAQHFPDAAPLVVPVAASTAKRKGGSAAAGVQSDERARKKAREEAALFESGAQMNADGAESGGQESSGEESGGEESGGEESGGEESGEKQPEEAAAPGTPFTADPAAAAAAASQTLAVEVTVADSPSRSPSTSASQQSQQSQQEDSNSNSDSDSGSDSDEEMSNATITPRRSARAGNPVARPAVTVKQEPAAKRPRTIIKQESSSPPHHVLKREFNNSHRASRTASKGTNKSSAAAAQQDEDMCRALHFCGRLQTVLPFLPAVTAALRDGASALVVPDRNETQTMRAAFDERGLDPSHFPTTYAMSLGCGNNNGAECDRPSNAAAVEIESDGRWVSNPGIVALLEIHNEWNSLVRPKECTYGGMPEAFRNRLYYKDVSERILNDSSSSSSSSAGQDADQVAAMPFFPSMDAELRRLQLGDIDDLGHRPGSKAQFLERRQWLHHHWQHWEKLKKEKRCFVHPLFLNEIQYHRRSLVRLSPVEFDGVSSYYLYLKIGFQFFNLVRFYHTAMQQSKHT